MFFFSMPDRNASHAGCVVEVYENDEQCHSHINALYSS